ncbi:unnamed protein product [Heligmosomoides polygyrus]|uniref:DUF1758 domain-containing protein n=1 Tax=Heligmosomoides polygyrus TaxID=6339 RepID=A0A183FVA5_HELPZ|nr:unnamed protein product [Heligmosomoides polygyrus]
MLVNANVYNARTRAYEALTVFLDSGSQPSFITASAVYRLGLSVSNRQSITLVTLGGHTSSEASGIVDTRFKDMCGEEFYLSLFVNDVLTAPQSTAALGRKDREFLASLGINDNMLCGDAQLLTPDILIGMDHY